MPLLICNGNSAVKLNWWKEIKVANNFEVLVWNYTSWDSEYMYALANIMSGIFRV